MSLERNARNVCVVHDLRGEVVGHVEAPETGPVRVTLDPPWDWIAAAINRDVQCGSYLMGSDRTLRIVRGTTELEVDTIAHAVRVLSEWKLRVTPGPVGEREAEA